MKTLTVTENIIEFLRFQIISAELKPGQRLSEAVLREHLSVSSAPLREAFRLLEREGLVISIPRKGSYVSDICLEDCREIYEARGMMECFSVSLFEAKGVRDLPEVASCLDAHHANQEPIDSSPQERYKYILARHRFHIKLIEASENRTLCSLYSNIFSRLLRYQYMYHLDFDPELTRRLADDHSRILEAISRGEYEESRQSLWRHFSIYGALIEKELSHMKRDEKPLLQVAEPKISFAPAGGLM